MNPRSRPYMISRPSKVTLTERPSALPIVVYRRHLIGPEHLPARAAVEHGGGPVHGSFGTGVGGSETKRARRPHLETTLRVLIHRSSSVGVHLHTDVRDWHKNQVILAIGRN